MAAYRAENPDFKVAARKRKSSGVKVANNSNSNKTSRVKTVKPKRAEAAGSDEEDEKPTADGDQADGNSLGPGEIPEAAEEDAAEEAGTEQQHSQEGMARTAGKRKAAAAAEKGISKSVRGESHAPLQRQERKRRTSAGGSGETKRARAAVAGAAGQDADLLSTEFVRSVCALSCPVAICRTAWVTVHYPCVQVPFETCPWPAPILFPKGAAVTLVLAPYRTFLSQLPADCVDAHTLQV
jgi:hypothetical protein